MRIHVMKWLLLDTQPASIHRWSSRGFLTGETFTAAGKIQGEDMATPRDISKWQQRTGRREIALLQRALPTTRKQRTEQSDKRG